MLRRGREKVSLGDRRRGEGAVVVGSGGYRCSGGQELDVLGRYLGLPAAAWKHGGCECEGSYEACYQNGREAGQVGGGAIYHYLDASGEEEKEILGEPRMKGMGLKKGLAVARGTEVDGASVVIWGGVSEKGQALDDGWLVIVDR